MKRALNEVGRARRTRVRVGREALLRSTRPADAPALHQSLYLIAPDVESGVLGRAGQFASSVDAVVLVPDLLDLRTNLGVAQ